MAGGITTLVRSCVAPVTVMLWMVKHCEFPLLIGHTVKSQDEPEGVIEVLEGRETLKCPLPFMAP